MIDLDKINTVNWENTNIAILGAGISGIGAAKLAIHLNATVLLSDVKKSELNIDKSSHLTYEYSGHSDKVLKSDLIIKSPGIPNEIDIIKKSKQKNIPIVSEIEFASWFSNSEIIAVTGSNGKTTTVNIIFEIFKEAAENI
jgi:UDP-N-acetylmuramoylalanine--D-glutamate ligase